MGLTVKEGAGVETPSAAIIAAGNKTATVTDARGRMLVVKKITALERMRLFRVAGGELAGNMPWIGLAAIASSVVSIDGEPQPKPGTVREIEALVSMLEDDGLDATAAAYEEHFGVTPASDLVDAAKN